MTHHFLKCLFFLLILVGKSIAIDKQSEPQTILIFNASSEIGQTLTKTYQSGDSVLSPLPNLILTARHPDKIQHLKTQNTSVVSLDFSNRDTQDLKAALQGRKVDGVVIMLPRPQIKGSLLPSPQDWQNCFDTCFINPLEAVREVLPHLKRGGKILIVGGISSRQALGSHPHFGILRLMWLGQAKSMATTLGDQDIHVNTIALAHTSTQTILKGVVRRAKSKGISREKQIKEDTDNVPLKRFATPQEVAHIIQFFLSSNSNFITGVNIPVDGGFDRSY